MLILVILWYINKKLTIWAYKEEITKRIKKIL
jgi:hypothetical protein